MLKMLIINIIAIFFKTPKFNLMLIKSLLSALLFSIAFFAHSQQMGTIKGKITDENYNNEPVAYANVGVYKMPTDKNAELIIVDGTSTDEKGEYVMSNIPEGNYVVEVFYVDFLEPLRINNVSVKANVELLLNLKQPKYTEKQRAKQITCIGCMEDYSRPMINVTEMSNTTTIEADDIRRMGIR